MIKTTVTVPHIWVLPNLDTLISEGKTDGKVQIVRENNLLIITRTWIDAASAQQYIDTGIAHYGDTITYSTEEVTV
jgi:hypothetical protein